MRRSAGIRRAAVVIGLALTFVSGTAQPAHAASAAAGGLGCAPATTLVTGAPSVSVGAGEQGGYFAWQPLLVDFNSGTPVYSGIYGPWSWAYVHSGSTSGWWLRFGDGTITDRWRFEAPRTGYWGIHNRGYDYRTGQYFNFGYSGHSGGYHCYFEPNWYHR